jgi:hypothetical protein
MDNLGVLNRLAFGQASSLKYHLKRNSDVIREIQSVQTSLQFPIYRQHVRSHQNDTNVDLSDLPFPTRVNKMCDTSCTLAHDCETCRPLPLHQSFLPPKPIFLSTANLRAAKLTSTFGIASKTDNSDSISSSAKNGRQPLSN